MEAERASPEAVPQCTKTQNMRCYTILYSAIEYYMILHHTILCDAMPCYAILLQTLDSRQLWSQGAEVGLAALRASGAPPPALAGSKVHRGSPAERGLGFRV